MTITAGLHLDTSNASASATMTLTAPADVVPGALMWVQISLGTLISAAPAGWTQVAAALVTSAPRLYAYSRVADATDTPGTTYAWTYGSATGSATIQTYLGVDTTTPVDATATTAGSATAATFFPVAGAVTVTSGALLLTGVATAGTTTTPTLTPPAGFTTRFDNIPKRHALADLTQTAAGDPGTLTWTVSASSAWTAYATALRPANVVAGPIALAGSPVETDTLAVTLNASNTVSLWTPTAVPVITANAATTSIEVGLRFSTSVAGSVLGIEFYKASTNTGTHVGTLWGPTGVSLATVTFTGETASGWQTAMFATPVAISTGQNYAVSYFDPNGHYSSDQNYFTAPYVNAPLTGITGVFNNTTSAFPAMTYNASNYWVDLVFQPAVQATVPTALAGSSVETDTLTAAPVTSATATTQVLYMRSGTTLVRARLGMRTGATVTYLSS